MIARDAIFDKIVLIGSKADSVPDQPNIVNDFYGVEMHGICIDQLLRIAIDGARPIRHWPEWQEYAWTLLWAVLEEIGAVVVRSSLTLTFVIVAGLFVLTSLAFWLFVVGWWIPLVPAPMCYFLSTIISAALLALK